jgi:hypothetical protein
MHYPVIASLKALLNKAIVMNTAAVNKIGIFTPPEPTPQPGFPMPEPNPMPQPPVFSL